MPPPFEKSCSRRGKKFDQHGLAEDFGARASSFTALRGRYEGFDQRVHDILNR